MPEIAAENYPFCTIDPNVGVVEVPDPRLAALAAIAKPQKVIPTTMEFVDIAGLVEGASKGEGLGNKFLAHIRETDAIAHVVRCFDNDDVVHVAGRLDPLSDIEIINTELALADLESVERAIARTEKRLKANEKEARQEMAVLEKLKTCLDEGHRARNVGPVTLKKAMVQDLHLITTKPVMYVANVSEDGFESNPYLDIVRKKAESEGASLYRSVPVSRRKLHSWTKQTCRNFCEELGLKESGLDQVIRAGYALLGIAHFLHRG